MHLQTYLLAFGRYAPVQVVTHGNSVRLLGWRCSNQVLTRARCQMTSGLGDSIDYFMSIDGAEPPLGVEHYSEQLVRMAAHHSAFLAPLPTSIGVDDLHDNTDAVPETGDRDAPSRIAVLVHRFRGWTVHSRRRGPGDGSTFTPQLPGYCSRGAVYLCPQTLYKVRWSQRSCRCH